LIQTKDRARARVEHRRMKHASVAFLGALVLAGSVSAALAADAQNGLKLSRTWCASCHLVSSDQKQGSPDAATFVDIARRTNETKPLAVFLATPHGQMPDMTLSQPEIADIIAYIRTLGPNPPPADQPKGAPASGLSGAIVPQR
jgi:mono/diheme cytochrome c family protein